MQALVARYPEIIGDTDGIPLLIRRELPVADGVEAPGRWSVDHLFVTSAGVPVLVELKRAVDTRLRREVVGQLLDYAANSVAYWQPGSIASAFAARCEAAGEDPEATLSTFLGGGQPECFWDQVDANFAAGRVKLVFVADVIPRELARIVEFLNEQMRADVRAVELKWYESDAGATTLVPRIIGETQRAASQKAAKSAAPAPISVDEWIAQNIDHPYGPDAASGAQAFVKMIQLLDGDVVVSKAQGSIMAVFRTDAGQDYYPMHLWKAKAEISPSFQYLLRRPGLASEDDRRHIYELFVGAAGKLSTPNLGGLPGFSAALMHQPHVQEAVTEAARALVDAARRD